MNDLKEKTWKIGKSKKMKFNDFRKKFYLDIREYYDDKGIERPGKKGISLNMDELLELVDNIDEIKKFANFVKKLKN